MYVYIYIYIYMLSPTLFGVSPFLLKFSNNNKVFEFVICFHQSYCVIVFVLKDSLAISSIPS